MFVSDRAGFDPQRLAKIDEHLLRRYIEPKKISGALTLVARHGELAHLSPLGMMDLEREKSMQEDTIFRIYSMSKPITSVALMTLWEEGGVQLSDPVHRFIPAWRDLRVYSSGTHPNYVTVPVERPMTVKDLLTHQSGLTYGFLNRTNVDLAYRTVGIGSAEIGPRSAAPSSLAEMMEKLAEIPLEFSPGQHWNYSVSTDVLGHLVEVISGQRFDDFLAERIFEPLGMNDTGFSVPMEQAHRLAANYGRGADKKLELGDDPVDSSYLKPPSFLSGGGGLVSTAGDYWRFCQMLLNGGELDGERVLGPRTIDLMTMNQLTGGGDLPQRSVSLFSETQDRGTGFGLGFAVLMDNREAGGSSVGEYNWGGAASTIFWNDPAENLVV
ncbi:MAG TPA: serine hydrolase domain-containing protein, partial [Dehalococcoidia bacterium]|nr:serine hydrolase domain-containing protein [Dehalococcoidia bacterium]